MYGNSRIPELTDKVLDKLFPFGAIENNLRRKVLGVKHKISTNRHKAFLIIADNCQIFLYHSIPVV